ncbi:MAG TPA: hypothetical protein DEF04_00450, partial [Clostridiales bacterium]|nr:hypothetical protein [Clostridiales bacterium]
MKLRQNQILAMLLVFLMVFSSSPMKIYATENFQTINNSEELNSLSDDLGNDSKFLQDNLQNIADSENDINYLNQDELISVNAVNFVKADVTTYSAIVASVAKSDYTEESWE